MWAERCSRRIGTAAFVINADLLYRPELVVAGVIDHDVDARSTRSRRLSSGRSTLSLANDLGITC